MGAVASTFVQTQPLSFGTLAPTAANGTATMSTGGLLSVSSMTIIPTSAGYKGTGVYSPTGVGGLLGVAMSTTVLTSPVILTNGNGGTITVDNIDATGDTLLSLLDPSTDVSVGGTAHITAASTPGDYVGYVDIQGSVLLSGSATMTMQITLKLLAQLGIEETTALNFGTIAVTGGNSVVRIAPISGTRSVVSGSEGVDLVVSRPGASGIFDITGEPNTPVSVQISQSSIQLSSSNNSMTVDTFRCLPTPVCTGSITIGITGHQIFAVGGDLHVGANQTAGTYNGNYTVTVNY